MDFSPRIDFIGALDVFHFRAGFSAIFKFTAVAEHLSADLAWSFCLLNDSIVLVALVSVGESADHGAIDFVFP